MKIILPKKYLGNQVVEAFKSASIFQETSNKRWESYEFVGQFQYKLGSAQQTIRSIGVITSSFSLRKKWAIFGKKVWKKNFTPKFTLEPIVLTKNYDAVEVTVEYTYDVDMGGHSFVATNPHSPEFEDIRPQFEKILENFFAQLTA